MAARTRHDHALSVKPKMSVDWIDPALKAAFEWAGSDEDRNDMDTLCAFVDMVRALDRYQRGERDA